MENKSQNTILMVLVILMAGLMIGYFLGSNKTWRDYPLRGGMVEEMTEHMYEDDIISQDGAMMHAMDEMMLGFRGKTGAAYEEAFLRGMIVHHLGAVAMAEELLQQTERPELKVFAQDIISVQSKEIDTMKGWLTAWFDNTN